MTVEIIKYQSSTTPDPGYQWESDKLTEDTTNESHEVSPFPVFYFWSLIKDIWISKNELKLFKNHAEFRKSINQFLDILKCIILFLGFHFRISMNRFYDINSNENTLLRDIKDILKSIYGYLKSLMISKKPC